MNVCLNYTKLYAIRFETIENINDRQTYTLKLNIFVLVGHVISR